MGRIKYLLVMLIFLIPIAYAGYVPQSGHSLINNTLFESGDYTRVSSYNADCNAGGFCWYFAPDNIDSTANITVTFDVSELNISLDNVTMENLSINFGFCFDGVFNVGATNCESPSTSNDAYEGTFFKLPHFKMHNKVTGNWDNITNMDAYGEQELCSGSETDNSVCNNTYQSFNKTITNFPDTPDNYVDGNGIINITLIVSSHCVNDCNVAIDYWAINVSTSFIAESEASFVSPTPDDSHRTNSNQSINVSCSQSPSGVYLYFTNESTTNESHLVLTNSTLTTFTTSYTSDGIYNYTANCEFEGIRGSNVSRTLELDTVSPIAIGINDISGSSGDVVETSITFSDNHFFGYNVTCPLTGFAQSQFGLDTTLYIANLSINLTVDDICTVFYADGHTARNLNSNWFTRIKNNELEFRIDSTDINYFSLVSNHSGVMKTKREHDRFTINVSFPNSQRGVFEDYVFHYRTSPNSYYIESEEFPGWVVDLNSLTWFDMQGADNVHVFRRGRGVYEIVVRTDAPHLALRSTGELNTELETFDINIQSQDDLFSLDVTSVPGIYIFIIIHFIWLALMFFGAITKQYLFSVTGAFIGLAIGLIFISQISILIGILLIVVNFAFIMAMAFGDTT